MIPAALAPLAAHLWQSTLFAAVAALLIVVLRNNQARVRYWVWLVASYKFLLPFSLLVGIGHLVQWRSAPQIEVSPMVSVVTDTVTAPAFLSPLPTVRSAPDHVSVLLLSICIVWACGFLAVVAAWMREWIRIRAVARSASPLNLDLPIRVVTTTAQIEPGVFGVFDPVLLLPNGIATRLTPAQLQGVLAHELAHARRNDNLTAAIHMLVEAIFWFHPFVWWIGARMVDERERACDEEVLREGKEAQAYAESIVKICEYYLESPLRCVSGITGSDLKKRVQRIMGNKLGESLNAWRKMLLVTAGVAALAVPLVAGVMSAAPRLWAQSPSEPSVPQWQIDAGGKMAFEVASVKQDTADPSHSNVHTNIPLGPLDFFAPTGGLLSVSNYPLVEYMVFAYKLNWNQRATALSQMPKWAVSARYDIEARGPANATKDQFRLMMQSLLTDRFKLAIHFEQRTTRVIALVVDKPGKLGPHLKAHVEDDPPCANTPASSGAPETVSGGFPTACGATQIWPSPTAGRLLWGSRNMTMANIARAGNLANLVDTELPIVDKTGLMGTYDFVVEFTPETKSAPSPNATSLPDSSGPSFLEAIKEQLGLRFESQKDLATVLVVDHIEEPSPN